MENVINSFNSMCFESSEEDMVRKTCVSCKRPLKVCWCQFLPQEKLIIKTKIYILQHPYEESRCLQTAAMLFKAFNQNNCKLYKGKKFSSTQYDDLYELSKKSNSILLFPSANSINIEDFVKNNQPITCTTNDDDDNLKVDESKSDVESHDHYNLFVLDGTWHHAKGIYFCNSFLHNMTQVKLNNTGVSKYTIRTQPSDDGLSTVESVALAVSFLEGRKDVYETLMKPLEGMCRFQLDHGAVVHQSKESLLKMGLKYPLKNKVLKNGEILENGLITTQEKNVTNDCKNLSSNVINNKNTAVL